MYSTIFLNNSLKSWLIAMFITIILCVVIKIFSVVILKRVQRLALRTTGAFDDFLIAVVQKKGLPFMYLLSFYSGLQTLEFSEKAEKILHTALMTCITYFIISIFISFVAYFFISYTKKKSAESEENRIKQANGILLIIKLIIWCVGVVFLIGNLGYNITTLITGLGIGGIAIALAAQAVLGDLFSYLVIFFDKPFEIGDFIVFEDKMGTIEYIGIKTTRLRALSGEQLICSNTFLTNSKVHNYKRMERRRIVFSLGVVYQTSYDKVKKLPAIIREIIQSQAGTLFDRAHFSGYGDFSLNFEVVYFVLSPDYNAYMDINQAINLAIYEAFEREQMEFAYPSQTIFMNK
ncbi:MAG: mechanosensitive ion channel family protein [Flavitalea sp.]